MRSKDSPIVTRSLSLGLIDNAFIAEADLLQSFILPFINELLCVSGHNAIVFGKAFLSTSTELNPSLVHEIRSPFGALNQSPALSFTCRKIIGWICVMTTHRWSSGWVCAFLRLLLSVAQTIDLF